MVDPPPPTPPSQSLSETEVMRIISVLNDCAEHNHRWTVNVYCVQASREFHLMHSNKFSEEMLLELQHTNTLGHCTALLVTITNSSQPARFISIVIPSQAPEWVRSVNKLLVLPQVTPALPSSYITLQSISQSSVTSQFEFEPAFLTVVFT